MKKENGLLDVAMNGYEGIKVFKFVGSYCFITYK